MPYELQSKLLKELKRRYPMMRYFRLSNTGSEAVMHAIKLARAFTAKDKIIKIEGSYHGTYDTVSISISSKPDEWGEEREPRKISGPGVPKSHIENTIIIQYNDLTSLEYILKKYDGEIAAMIIEPVAMNSVGVILPKKGYLEGVRRLTREHNVLLIADEVKTGLRIAPGGATEYFKMDPDIVTLAKALGGGVPIAAFGFKEELSEIMYPKGKHTHSGTYNGNPLSAATAYRNLTRILTDQAYHELNLKGDRLAEEIRDVITDLDMPLTVTHIGSVGTIHFMPWEPSNYREVAKNYDYKSYMNYWMKMFLRDILIRAPIVGEPWFMSLAHTDRDIEETIEATNEVFREMKNM
jgi:glutamate-1-semialdehyde 2,1-aminomutase